MIKIAKVMGTDELYNYVRKYKINIPTQVAKFLKSYPPQYLEEFINKNNQSLVSEEALDLLRKMLVYDKNLRITPIDALKHPYFNPVKQFLASKQ
jgi:casein kinase II subunit alpha